MIIKMCSLCYKVFKEVKGKMVWVDANKKEIRDFKRGGIFATICDKCVDAL